MPACAGTVFSYIAEKNYFFLAAFFFVAFFFVAFFALVAIVVNLHVELVRAQYIHKTKLPSKCSLIISLLNQDEVSLSRVPHAKKE